MLLLYINVLQKRSMLIGTVGHQFTLCFDDVVPCRPLYSALLMWQYIHPPPAKQSLSSPIWILPLLDRVCWKCRNENEWL